MDTKTLIIASGVLVAFFSIMIYAALAVFFPEWVGITGKVARNAEKSHEEGTVPEKNGNIMDSF